MLNTVSVWEDIASWRSFRWQMKRRRMGPVKMWSGRSGKRGAEDPGQIKDGAYVLALAIEGKMLSSEELAGKIQKLGVEGKGHLVFGHRWIPGTFQRGDGPGRLCSQFLKNDISAPADAGDTFGADLQRI